MLKAANWQRLYSSTKGSQPGASRQHKCLREDTENLTSVIDAQETNANLIEDAMSLNINKEDDGKTTERLAFPLNFL